MQHFGLEQMFDEIIGGDMVRRSKPDPEIYLTACRVLGADPAETYAVEDSYNGIRSAAAAGMRPVMIPDLLPPTPEIESLTAKIFVKNGRGILPKIHKRSQSSCRSIIR